MCVDVCETSLIPHVKASAKHCQPLCLVNALPVAVVQRLVSSFPCLCLALGSGHKSQSRMDPP